MNCHSERGRPKSFFHVRSRERVGLRSEESLFDFIFVLSDPKFCASSSS
jgi:hypothetical protein